MKKKKKGGFFKVVFILALATALAAIGYDYADKNNRGNDVPPSPPPLISDKVEKNELSPDKFYTVGERVYYDDTTVKYGIDVSSHQKDIDWEKVASDGIDFAIIRAGYRGYGKAGKINEDEYLKKNLDGALKNGLAVGVYFFSQAITVEEAREEARFVLDLIEGYDLTYPVFYDWEYITYDDEARTHDYKKFDISAFANAFSQVVSEAGYTSSVYFNPNYGYRLYDIDEIAEHHFWLAEYKERPQFYYGFSIWQYSNTGKVDGINGSVDMNISFTDFYKV